MVQSLAEVVQKHGGNWLESRMCRLGGQFAGILRVRLDPQQVLPLQRDLTHLGRRGLMVSVQAGMGEVPSGPADAPVVAFAFTGRDRPGLVHQIASVLAGEGANVEDFQSECLSEPMSGEVLFQARVRARVRPGQAASSLRQAVAATARDLFVDVLWE